MSQVGPVDSTISTQRNAKLVKDVEKQLNHEQKLIPPRKSGGPERKPNSKRLSNILQKNKVSSNRSKPKTPERVRKAQTHPKISTQLDIPLDGAFRFDAVVFVIVLVQIVGYVALIMEIYVFALDQHWNKVLHGEKKIHELPSHNIFKDKTYHLDQHEYLRKARDFALRERPQEIIFIILIVLFILVSTIHLFSCYIRTDDFEEYSEFLIGLYAVGGAICILSSTLLISAATDIENNYSYAADMLYNFQHAYQDQPNDPSKCIGEEYGNGCKSYQYAVKQMSYLEKIFRLCGDGSRFTRYYKSQKVTQQSVTISGETYFRHDLKELGFCSRDGYKIAAAVLAVVMGVLSSLIPIIYCCESKSVTHRDSYLVAVKAEGIRRKSVNENKKVETETPVFVKEFRAYVERNSADDLIVSRSKRSKKKRRSKSIDKKDTKT